MTNYYKTKDGDFFPFSNILRIADLRKNFVRVYFVNGSIDIDTKIEDNFLNEYQKWLEADDF